jgi:hypothetical protein
MCDDKYQNSSRKGRAPRDMKKGTEWQILGLRRRKGGIATKVSNHRDRKPHRALASS